MKATNYIYLLLAGLLGLTSCADDGLGHDEDVVSGIPTTIKVNFSTPEAENIATKSASVSNYTKIKSLYIFIFDENGKLDGSASPDVSTATYISIPTTTGPHTIYGVANYYGTELGNISEDLAAVSTLTQLKALTAKLTENKLEIVNNSIMMSGFYAKSETDAKNGIVGEANFGAANQPSEYTVYLNRLFSGVNFNISCSNSSASFTLSSYRIVNAPYTSTLFGSNGSPSLFNASTSQAFETTDAKVSSFSFYMLENAAGTKSVSTYAERESRTNQGTEQIRGDWVKAPENATYIVLKGHYSGPATVSGSSQTVSADVTYYIHLGNFTKNFGDYNSYRNKNYTYNVHVYGVNNIVVEVEDNDAEYGPADATISFGGNTFYVDAHYSSFNVTLNGGESYTYQWDQATYGTEPWVYLVLGKNKTYSDIKEADLIKSVSELNAALSTLSGTQTFTAFVNENYPMQGDDWSNYVNTDNRTFKILPTSAASYTNGSAIVNDGLIISQKPIMTFFNNNNSAYGIEWTNESHAVAYGSSSNTTNDDGRKNMLSEIKNKNWNNVYSINQAYIACMQRNRDENHDGKITDDEVRWYMPSLIQASGLWMGASILGSAWFFNGSTSDLSRSGGNDYVSINGVVQSSAVRDSTYHYWTSTSTDSSNKQYIWAEEGSSYGKAGTTGTKYQVRCIRNLGSIATSSNTFYSYSGNVFDLSKIRSEAIRGNVSSELRNHNEQDPSNKLPKKFRVAVNDVYSSATASYSYNYYTFRYEYPSAPTTFNLSTYTWKTVNANIDSDVTKSPCYSYAEDNIVWKRSSNKYTISSADDLHKWRLPNQRELSLMVTAGVITTNHMCRTYFSNQNYRLGYAFANNFYLLGPNSSDGSFYIRCVKDVE